MRYYIYTHQALYWYWCCLSGSSTYLFIFSFFDIIRLAFLECIFFPPFSLVGRDIFYFLVASDVCILTFLTLSCHRISQPPNSLIFSLYPLNLYLQHVGKVDGFFHSTRHQDIEKWKQKKSTFFFFFVQHPAVILGIIWQARQSISSKVVYDISLFSCYYTYVSFFSFWLWQRRKFKKKLQILNYRKGRPGRRVVHFGSW